METQEGNAKPRGPIIRREDRDLFLRDWEVEVLPKENQAAAACQAAVDYSILGLKSAFLLNGGALVALPAFISIFGKETACLRVHIGYISACFVLGIGCVATSTALSYFTTHKQEAAHWSRREISANQILALYYEDQNFNDQAEAAVKTRDENIAAGIVLQKWAIGMALASAGAFLLGALLLVQLALG